MRAANKYRCLFFYYNAYTAIEGFRNEWIANLSCSEQLRLMFAIHETLVSLRADDDSRIDVSAFSYSSDTRIPFGGNHDQLIIFLWPAFPNFVKHVLQSFYPALRDSRFHCVIDANNVPNYVWGDSRDKSLLVPRLTAMPATLNGGSQRYINFRANSAWIASRNADLSAGCVGRGHLMLAMGMHTRLGRDSQLHLIPVEILRVVVNLLDALPEILQG